MRTTTPRVLAATEMVNNHSYNGILLDSGATHMLRHPYHDKGEWQSAAPTEVRTATGKTQLRMAQNSIKGDEG